MSKLCYNPNYNVSYGSKIDLNGPIDSYDEYELMENEKLYREEFLEVFGLRKDGDYDETHINSQIDLIFNMCIKYPIMRNILNFVEQHNPFGMMFNESEHSHVAFMILFSYDLFYYTHPCVSYIIKKETGELDDDYSLIAESEEFLLLSSAFSSTSAAAASSSVASVEKVPNSISIATAATGSGTTSTASETSSKYDLKETNPFICLRNRVMENLSH